MANNLKDIFDISSETPSGHTLDELRQHYFIEAISRGDDSASIGGLQVNTNGRKDAAALALRKQRQATNDMLLIDAMMRDFAAMTNKMIDKYGEDFAEQFAADLLEPDVFAELMKIEDPEARQQAIAQAILDGIANGTIDPKDAYANPDFADWLKKYDEISEVSQKAQITLSNEQQNLDNTPETQTQTNLSGLDSLGFS